MKTIKNIFYYIRNRFFQRITYAVWLNKDNRIVGWKIKCGYIDHLTTNTMVYYPYHFTEVQMKKKTIYVLRIGYLINKAFMDDTFFCQWQHVTIKSIDNHEIDPPWKN